MIKICLVGIAILSITFIIFTILVIVETIVETRKYRAEQKLLEPFELWMKERVER